MFRKLSAGHRAFDCRFGLVRGLSRAGNPLAILLYQCERETGNTVNGGSTLQCAAGNFQSSDLLCVGVQRYKAAKVKNADPAAFEWVLVAPQADLYDFTNAKVGTHSAGPGWTLYNSNSRVVAQNYIPARSTSNDSVNLDWQLLMPKVGTTPTGIFEDIHYIQQIATEGGKAPFQAPANIHETINVPFTAVYRFSRIDP